MLTVRLDPKARGPQSVIPCPATQIPPDFAALHPGYSTMPDQAGWERKIHSL